MGNDISIKNNQPSIESALKLLLILFILIIMSSVIIKSPYYSILSFYITFILFLLIMIKIKNLNIIKVFNVKKINYRLVILSILIGGTTWFIYAYLTCLVTFLLNLIGKPPGLGLPHNVFELSCLVFCFVILTPLCEEFFFRGYVLNAFKKFGFIQAIVFSSFLFGIYHLDLSRVISTVFFGLIAGYLLYRTESVFSSMLAHGTLNLLGLLFKHHVDSLQFDIYDTLHFYNILVFPAILLIIPLLGLLKKQTPFVKIDKKRFQGFWNNVKSLSKIWSFNLIVLIFLVSTFIYLLFLFVKRG